MKKAIALFFLLSAICGHSQLKKLKVFCTDNFSPKASITVEQKNSDVCLAVDALKNSLVMNGFRVISERVAQEQVNLSNRGQVSDTAFNQDIGINKSTRFNSVYIVTLDYRHYTKEVGCGGRTISNMTGQVIDLANEGEIVATFSFSQGSMGMKCASTVMSALAKALKEKKR